MREIIERTAHNKINPSAHVGNIKERLTWLSSSKEMILDVGCGNIPRGDVNVDLCVPNDILKGKGLARRNERGALSIISIIVPTLNEEKHIAYLFASLKMQTYPNFEVIVVDGGSKDQTIEIARKYGAKTIVLPGYREFPSRNVGASMAVSEILLFTCADVIFPKNLLAKICEKFERDPQLLAVSGPSVPYDASLMGKIMYGIYNIIRYLFSKLPGKLRRFSTSTNFLAVRREAFEKTGGFLDDINADGLMGRKLIKMGKVDFDIKLYVYISARRMKNMGLSKFITHYLYILENFFPFLSHTNLIKGFKKKSRSIHRKLHEHT